MVKRILIVLVAIIFLWSCNQNENHQWVTTEEGYMLWLKDSECVFSYSWHGETFEQLAHGRGVLYKEMNNSIIDSSIVTAYYGTINENDIIEVSTTEHYIGEIDSLQYNGFGVLIKPSETIIGSFRNSMVNGCAAMYKSNGLVYKGQFKNHRQHGEGIQIDKNDTIWGIWNNGKLVDKKVSFMTEKGRYKGFIKDGKPNGIGKMNYHDGNYYDGEWSNGKFDGNGLFKSEIIDYEGEWSFGLPDGLGKMTVNNESYYDGDWIGGHRCGFGESRFANGDLYLGDWESDLFDGIGIYFYCNGDEYNGEWKNGLQDGVGTITTDSFTYFGHWEEGWMNGEGCIEYPNGDYYFGDLVENQRYGVGHYEFADGNSYDGEFVDDTFNGLGVFYFKEGGKYEGEFHDGKICGDGTFYCVMGNDTVAITANWDGTNNFPKEASILFANGDIYEGEIINGMPTENGVWSRYDDKSGIRKALENANYFYKEHEETIKNVTKWVCRGLVAVAFLGSPLGLPAAVISGLWIADNTIYAIEEVANIGSNLLDGNNHEAICDASIDIVLIFAPSVVKKVSRRFVRELSPFAKRAGKEIGKSIIRFSEKSGFKKLITVSIDKSGKYIKGTTTAIAKYIPQSLHAKNIFHSKFLESRIAKTQLKKDLDNIIAKGPIKLTKKEMESLLSNPKDYFRAFIQSKTGDKKNFQEFFIRLAMGNKKQVAELLDNSEIRKMVNRRIRSGAQAHEWLMTKNFEDFLLNPKWGKDGPFLALSLTKFTQKTASVIYKNGGRHPSSGVANSSLSKLFHEELGKVIDNCNTKEEVFLAVKHYAKKNLTKDSYKEFCNIFKEVFMTPIK